MKYVSEVLQFHLIVHFQAYKMFLQAQQEAIYFQEICQEICFKFLDALDHLWSHLGTVEDAETIAPPALTGQDHSKRSILSGFGDIF